MEIIPRGYPCWITILLETLECSGLYMYIMSYHWMPDMISEKRTSSKDTPFSDNQKDRFAYLTRGFRSFILKERD